MVQYVYSLYTHVQYNDKIIGIVERATHLKGSCFFFNWIVHTKIKIRCFKSMDGVGSMRTFFSMYNDIVIGIVERATTHTHTPGRLVVPRLRRPASAPPAPA